MIAKFLKNEEGLETVEYAIITGLIVAGVIAVIGAIGLWVFDQFSTVEGELSGS